MSNQWYWINRNNAYAVEIIDEASLTVKRMDTGKVFTPSMAKLFTMDRIEQENQKRSGTNKIVVK